MPTYSNERVSWVRLANVLLVHRRVLVIAPLLVAGLVLGWSLLTPRTYTVEASFTPHAAGDAQRRGLAGLASQFGLSIPTEQSAQTPAFYADLLQSRGLLKEVVRAPYRLTRDGSGQLVEGDLVSLFGIRAQSRPLAIELAVERLHDEFVAVSVNRGTGVVKLSVTSTSSDLSRQIAQRLLELVNHFNLEIQQSQAEAEREFIGEQLAEAESGLLAAEDSLERFLQGNRRYENSPELVFHFERLQRRVSLRNQVFTSLSQSYAQAKIDEVRNTPVITVVEQPEAPARPDDRRLVLKTTLGLLIGGIFAVLWAVGRGMIARDRQREPDDWAEFNRLRRLAVSDVRRLWRR